MTATMELTSSEERVIYRAERMREAIMCELRRWASIHQFRNVPGTDKYVVAKDEIDAAMQSLVEAIR